MDSKYRKTKSFCKGIHLFNTFVPGICLIMKKVYLGIGSNLGDREANLKGAVESIGESIGLVVKSSSVYETEPWGFNSEDKFLNMVLEVETDLSPSDVLNTIHQIETKLGRIRGEVQYSSRVIDIDIIFYEDLKIIEKNLIIPHPLMYERKFVLIPFCDIAPDFLHPVLKRTIASLLNSCRDKTEVVLYNNPLSAKL